jgi:type III secretory pathway lipoprotein EscJ
MFNCILERDSPEITKVLEFKNHLKDLVTEMGYNNISIKLLEEKFSQEDSMVKVTFTDIRVYQIFSVKQISFIIIFSLSRFLLFIVKNVIWMQLNIQKNTHR